MAGQWRGSVNVFVHPPNDSLEAMATLFCPAEANIRWTATSRWKIRVTLCRCLLGASRSAGRIPSITALYGSSADGSGGSGLRGSGQAESTALRTVRRPTLY